MARHVPALAAALLVVGAACREGKAATQPAPPPTVLVASVAQRDVPLFVEAVGSLDGYVNVDIRARVRGFLERQTYQDGATVKEGQLLFTIEGSEHEAAAASARASLARALAAQAHHRAQLARKRELAPSGFVSKQELDDAHAQAQDADAAVRMARSQVQQAELNLSYTQIRAPISGLAGLALVRPGNLVGQDGPTLLTTLSQVDPIRVNFPMSEIDYVRAPDQLKRVEGRDLAWARRQFERLAQAGVTEGGDRGLELVLSDGRSYPHRGVIVSANRQVDAASGTIQVQALFPNPDRVLRPGQYGRVRLPRQDDNALVVPEKALVQVQGTYSVAVVGADDRVQLRRVDVGPRAGGLRIVSSGVRRGERIVVEGIQKVSDGALVTPQPAPEAAAAGDPSASGLAAASR